MTYGYLLESVWHPPLFLGEQVAASMPSEMELQALWFSGAFGRDFRSTSGKEVRIVQFGEWNRSAGPDFSHAAIEVDGETFTGSLEIDIDSSSWEHHGHGNNDAFRDVALHVVFRDDPRHPHTRTVDHREVPRIVISESELAGALNRPPRETAIAHPGRCVAPLRNLNDGALVRLLEEAARHRAQIKAERFQRTAAIHGPDVALYEATATTLGYRGNSLPMRLLAQRAPLAKLRAALSDCEAILFGTAGFLTADLHEQAPDETRDYLRGLWDIWWRERGGFESVGIRSLPWKLHGQRPANHPHRRVGALSAIVRQWPKFRSLALAQPFAVKPLVDFLQALDHPFWRHHHTLTSAAAPRGISIFGKTHALELAANHLIPLALAENRMTFRDYWKLRQSSPNENVKRCAIRLFGTVKHASPWTRRVCHHQALIQIYQDFCLEDFTDCSNCPFPEQLLQWK
ncbi:MAG: DUF2851 family protein [Verrucomicrobiota bacterium]